MWKKTVLTLACLAGAGPTWATDNLRIEDLVIVDEKVESESLDLGGNFEINPNDPGSINGGSFPSTYQSASFPSTYQSSSFPSTYQSSSFPSTYQSSSFPSTYQSTSFPSTYQSSSFPSTYQSSSFPSTVTGNSPYLSNGHRLDEGELNKHYVPLPGVELERSEE